jgi:hypothetical protein
MCNSTLACTLYHPTVLAYLLLGLFPLVINFMGDVLIIIAVTASVLTG